MPAQTLRPDAGQPEPGIADAPVPPATYSAQKLDSGESLAEVAAQQRIAEARAWQWSAALRGDLCEHRTATAALERVCDELSRAGTTAPARQ